MFPRNKALQHKAAPMLLDWAINGCPTNCGPHWTSSQLQAYLNYGNHKSATHPAATTAITLETQEKVAAGLCRLVSWDTISANPPATLKISPLAAVPHKSRAFRLIHDLSFQLHHASGALPKKEYLAVNNFSDTDHVPHHSMFELGNVIPRLLHHMATADPNTPIFFTKIDIKDGYWRLRIRKDHEWNFVYTLPKLSPEQETILAICLTLAMGWIDSPPYFCAVTETARDIIVLYESEDHLSPHPLEQLMLDISPADRIHLLPVTPTTPRSKNHPEVYMDDFIGCCQPTCLEDLTHHSRAMLHAIHDIFPPSNLTGSPLEDPISAKKLKEEGAWSTQKEVLGWLLDGANRTISITDAKATKLTEQLLSIIQTTRSPLKPLVQLHGALNWISSAVVTGKPLLGHMDSFLAPHLQHNHSWVNLPLDITQLLRDWCFLIKRLRSRPTSVYELLPTPPAFKGWCDASTSWGAGGVWFGGTTQLKPIVWSLQWPADILTAISSETFHINTLELFAILVQRLVLEAAIPSQAIYHTSCAIWSDNTTAVSQTNKLRTSKCPAAHRILRVLTTRMHGLHAAPITASHISGEYNTLADTASRPHPTDPLAFLQFFSTSFPPPQAHSWTLCLLPSDTIQQLFSLLQMQQLKLASFLQLNLNGTVFGSIGQVSSTNVSHTSRQHFQKSHPLPGSPCWLPSPSLFEKGSINPHTAAHKSVPKQSQWHSAPSPRPSCWMDNQARWLMRKGNTTSPLNANLRATEEMTLPANPKLPFLSMPSNILRSTNSLPTNATVQ